MHLFCKPLQHLIKFKYDLNLWNSGADGRALSRTDLSERPALARDETDPTLPIHSIIVINNIICQLLTPTVPPQTSHTSIPDCNTTVPE